VDHGDQVAGPLESRVRAAPAADHGVVAAGRRLASQVRAALTVMDGNNEIKGVEGQLVL